MSDVSSEVQAQIEFWQAIQAVSAERDAAYATKVEDPDRWRAAKQAYADVRSFFSALHQSGHGDAVEGVVVTPEPVEATGEALAPEGV
jgi:hypothetical protein